MRALIDADLVAFRCAASAENDPADIAILRADKLMRDILEATQADSYSAFLTGSGNFRKLINSEYKANRKDKPLPVHLQTIRQFLIEEWKASITEGHEADDALGMNEGIICSLDKDLDQIQGLHYNWVNGNIYEVSYMQGIKHFWKQMLIGDVADNLFGVKGIGKVKASKLIDPLNDEEEMFWTVSDLYDSSERFWMNADCFWIWREPGGCFSDL